MKPTALVALIVLQLFNGSVAIAASGSSGPSDVISIELIVKFHRTGKDVIDPATALKTAVSVAENGQPGDFGLWTRMGAPAHGQWLITNRLSKDYLETLAKEYPDHPEIHLQQYVVLGYPDPVARLQAQSKLANDASVLSVSANTAEQQSYRVNDYFVSVTGPGSAPQGYQWGLEAINVMSPWWNPMATSGWDYTKGWGYVAVVDSGLEVGHPDLSGRVRSHFSQAFYTGCIGNLTNINELGDPACPNSQRGHGTHVAGVIAGIADNSIGVSGVCHFCSLIVAKVFNNNVGTVADTVNGVNHSIIRGAPIINRSGGGQDYLARHGIGVDFCWRLAPGTDGYCDVIKLAALRDVVLVAASGNENNVKYSGTSFFATHFPATEPDVVAVGGTVYGNAIWSGDTTLPPFPVQGSNLDKPVDFVAPAKRIVSTFYNGATWFYPTWCSDSINAVSTYDECTGTSMAAPFVSGSYAIARALNPLLTRAQLKSQLQSVATYVGGYAMPNVLATAPNIVATNNSLTPLFVFVIPGGATVYNRFYTAFPQMGVAARKGTLLPLPVGGTPVVYTADSSANTVAGYPALPDSSGTPRAYFYVYTREKVSGQTMVPLRRLSKLQNVGGGMDSCGYPMPLPGKYYPLLHTYTTNNAELTTFQSSTAGNCFSYDGIEGWIATTNWTGTLQALYRLYNPSSDNYILVPQSKLAIATSLGYTVNQTLLGYVVSN